VIAVPSTLRILTLALIALLPWAAHAQGKIGFVNTERVMREAAPAQRAQQKIEAEFKQRDQELSGIAGQLKAMQDEIERSSVTMSDSQRRAKEREFGELNREFQRKQREFREDLNQRRNEELARVVEQANGVIRSIAAQEEFDLVIQDAVYANPRIDITEKVIKALDDK